MKENGMRPQVVDFEGRDKISRPVNFFIVALGAAVVFHLLFFEGFLLVLPSKNFHPEKGLLFLGSILDSSQMEKRPFLSRVADNEQTVFSRHVPPRSEREYFESLKDVAKPMAGVTGRKRDVKSMFPGAYRRPVEKNASQWRAGEAADYQPLRLPDPP